MTDISYFAIEFMSSSLPKQMMHLISQLRDLNTPVLFELTLLIMAGLFTLTFVTMCCVSRRREPSTSDNVTSPVIHTTLPINTTHVSIQVEESHDHSNIANNEQSDNEIADYKLSHDDIADNELSDDEIAESSEIDMSIEASIRELPNNLFSSIPDRHTGTYLNLTLALNGFEDDDNHDDYIKAPIPAKYPSSTERSAYTVTQRSYKTLRSISSDKLSKKTSSSSGDKDQTLYNSAYFAKHNKKSDERRLSQSDQIPNKLPILHSEDDSDVSSTHSSPTSCINT